MKAKALFILAFLTFALNNVFSQSHTIKANELIGCWKFTEFVDAKLLKPLEGKRNPSPDLRFNADQTYAYGKRNGDWELNKDSTGVYLFTDEISENEKKLADIFHLEPRVATRMELTGMKIEKDLLYYLMQSKTKPTTFYSKYKKAPCP